MKFKNNVKFCMLQRKNMQVFIGPLPEEGRFKSINPFLPKLFRKTTEKPQEMIFYGLCDLCAIREDPTH